MKFSYQTDDGTILVSSNFDGGFWKRPVYLPLVQKPFVQAKLNGQVPERGEKLRVVWMGCDSRRSFKIVPSSLLLNQDVGKVGWRWQGRCHHRASRHLNSVAIWPIYMCSIVSITHQSKSITCTQKSVSEKVHNQSASSINGKWSGPTFESVFICPLQATN